MQELSYLESLPLTSQNFIYSFNNHRTVELNELVVYSEAAFSYKMILEHKRTGDKITVRSSNLYPKEDRLFNHHELNGISFNTQNWRLILQTDPLFGEGNFELKYSTID